jgi:hypothetical protein
LVTTLPEHRLGGELGRRLLRRPRVAGGLDRCERVDRQQAVDDCALDAASL